MKKFLKLIAENQPGAQDEFTVTLTDPVGEVVNQFTITGGDFAFDNFQEFKEKLLRDFQEFKEEMTGVVEDQESDIDVAQIATKDNEDIEKAKDELNKKLVQSMNKLTSQIK